MKKIILTILCMLFTIMPLSIVIADNTQYKNEDVVFIQELIKTSKSLLDNAKEVSDIISKTKDSAEYRPAVYKLYTNYKEAKDSINSLNCSVELQNIKADYVNWFQSNEIFFKGCLDLIDKKIMNYEFEKIQQKYIKDWSQERLKKLENNLLNMSNKVVGSSKTSSQMNNTSTSQNNNITNQSANPNIATTGIVRYGTIFLPVRYTFESLGFKVSQDDSIGKIYATNGVHEISMIKGTKYYKISGHEISKSVLHDVIDGEFYMPIDYFDGAFVPFKASFDIESKTATIVYNKKNEIKIQCGGRLEDVEINYTGIIIGNGTDVPYKMMPLKVLGDFGFAASNATNDGGIEFPPSRYRDSSFCIDADGIEVYSFGGESKMSNYSKAVISKIGYLRNSELKSNAESIEEVCLIYNKKAEFYISIDDFCKNTGAEYSWDSTNKVAHLNYWGKHCYMKFYDKFDTTKTYKYMVPNAVNMIPLTILEDDNTLKGIAYQYVSYDNFIGIRDSYVNKLKANGYTVVDQYASGYTYNYKLKKGNISVIVTDWSNSNYKEFLQVSIYPK